MHVDDSSEPDPLCQLLAEMRHCLAQLDAHGLDAAAIHQDHAVALVDEHVKIGRSSGQQLGGSGPTALPDEGGWIEGWQLMKAVCPTIEEPK